MLFYIGGMIAIMSFMTVVVVVSNGMEEGIFPLGILGFLGCVLCIYDVVRCNRKP